MQTVNPVTEVRATPIHAGHHGELPDAEHLVVCLECGQAYDRRRVALVLHHAEPGHDPRPLIAG